MRVIMDFSWNHTGTLFWAWQDILAKQADSKYKNWYNISSFDNPQTPENEFKYDGWYGNAYMPEFRKTDITGIRINGKPYEGNLDEGVKKHIFDVTKRWLAPNGNTSKGVDGYRLDVADQIGLDFWRDYRTFVRSVKDDAYLIGEIWWEKWPNVLMDPTPYMHGDMFDAVMFYQVYRPARYFFANTHHSIDARQLKDSLQYHWNKLDKQNLKAMMNVSSSHDAPRLLTDFYNPNNYKYHANPNENPAYKTGKPDKESYARLRLYLIHLFTTVGAPQIWNGEEMGMWGADDPYGRKPLMWKEMKFEPENRNNISKQKPVYDKVRFDQATFNFYKKLIQIRKENPVLVDGETDFLLTEGKKLIYKRYTDTSEIIVVFNLEAKTQTVQLADGNYVDLITGKSINGKNLKVKSMEGFILKQNN
jgi:glycosidase